LTTESFEFNLPTRIQFGVGASGAVGAEAKDLGGTRALLVTDKGVREAGVIDGVLASLEAAGLGVVVFDDIAANPRDASVGAGADLARSEQCDIFVAVGGGSPIDAAKAMTAVHAHGGTVQDYESDPDCWFKVPGPVTPLIALPTTAGTGSEVTFWAVITDTERSYKMGVGDPQIAPKLALVDPSLTVGLPPAVTAATGMDALTHAVEGYTAVCASPLSDALALAAVRLIAGSLRQAFANGGNINARSDMLLASLLAGVAFSNSDVAGVHAMAEVIGGVYDTPHGVANAIYLPIVMDYNVIAAPERFAEIAREMGERIDGLPTMTAARKSVDAVRSLSADLGIPTAREVGVRDEDLQMLAERAQRNLGTPDNPRVMSVDAFRQLYEVGQAL